MTLPGDPTTENAARHSLVEACLRMNALGINQGKAGNASLRWDRGGAPGLLVTPSALAYEAMDVDDIVWLSMATRQGSDGEPAPVCVDGARPPSSEWRMHRDVYAARAEVAAVVHSHASFASTLACTERVQREGIPAFHYMIAVFGGADLRCARYATFGTQALSDNALQALQGRLGCLLANHGLLALGDSLERALGLAVELETLSRMYWQALQLGEPVVLDASEMRRVIARFAGYG
jgi:L-fuculose-phosphate aldolase